MTDTPDLRRQLPIDGPCSACGDGDSDMQHHDHAPPFSEPALPELLEKAREHVMTDEYPPCNCAATQDAHFFCHGDECQYKRAVVARYVAASGDSRGGAQPDTTDLQENIDSNDRLAEGLVRGVKEMGASGAELPVHIDGERWDVTVRFRAQPEPDLGKLELRHGAIWTCVRSVDHGLVWRPVLTAQELRDAIERAVSSPAPSPERRRNRPVAEHVEQLKEMVKWALTKTELAAIHWALNLGGVTGNEGKDEMESRGKDITVDGGTPSGVRAGSAGAPLPDPLASPAVVTPADWESSNERSELIEGNAGLRAKVSGLEAQLQQALEVTHIWRRTSEMWMETANRREAELERMRAGGKS